MRLSITVDVTSTGTFYIARYGAKSHVTHGYYVNSASLIRCFFDRLCLSSLLLGLREQPSSAHTLSKYCQRPEVVRYLITNNPST